MPDETPLRCKHGWETCTECHFGVTIERKVPRHAVAAPDLINHPPHYTSHPSGIECIEITRHFNFNVGNAIKYLWRAGLKANATEDLRKARWYIEDEIKRLGGTP